MLDFLHIENIAVAKKLDIDFAKGFNVLTGETGAGKSVIIGSINMLMGGKVSKDIIRHGEERALVSALFSNLNDSFYKLCDELDIEYDRDDSFSISRSFTLDGKNIVKINSRPVTLAQLKAISTMLINIHGQNDNHSFMNKANHLTLLDEYIDIEELFNCYSSLYTQLTAKKAEISRLYEQNKQTAMMVDILNYQIKEISSAKLKNIDEEEKLIELRNKLKGAEKIVKNASNVYKLLLKNESGVSATVLIDKAIDALNKLADLEENANEMVQKLTDFKYEIEDIAERAFDFASIDGIDEPEKQLAIVEDRLAVIQRLEKKYGANIEEIIKFKQDAESKLNDLENGEYKLEELKKEYKVLHQKAFEIAENMHALRVDGAKKLSSLVKEVLVFLDMPKVKFDISINKLERESGIVLSSCGFDDVEFMIATNAGENLSAMNKIASGGELSRIMLALKSAVSDKNGAQTVIFDEIDTGVSGSTSQKIGLKLANISRSTQTICVTHSAQIAALSDTHYLIKKVEVDGRAETNVKALEATEKIDEIARIIGGIELTDKQYAAARELIKQSAKLLSTI